MPYYSTSMRTTSSVKGQHLPLMENFFTLQGEGFHQGKGAYFIRLGGCDVGCVWCDTKDSWEAERYPRISVDQIAHRAHNSDAELAVITGGEPLMHPLGPLTQQLHNKGLQIHLETSGAHPLSGYIDWICLSPKKFTPPRSKILSQADELKIIVYNQSDFQWAERYAEQMEAPCHLFLQPEWSQKEKMLPLIVNYIQEHPRWQLSLQMHKYINLP